MKRAKGRRGHPQGVPLQGVWLVGAFEGDAGFGTHKGCPYGRYGRLAHLRAARAWATTRGAPTVDGGNAGSGVCAAYEGTHKGRPFRGFGGTGPAEFFGLGTCPSVATRLARHVVGEGALRGRSPRTREGRLGPTAQKSSGQWLVVSGQLLEPAFSMPRGG